MITLSPLPLTYSDNQVIFRTKREETELDMTAGNRQRPKTRMIHVRLPDELHKKVRIQAAETDMTLQDWVAMAIKNELDHRKNQKDNRTG